MDWRLFLHVAEWALPASITETDPFKLARVRTAIGRAYYAAHNVARLYSKNKGWAFIEHDGRRNDWPSHEKLWDLFLGAPLDVEKDVGDLGHTMRTMRNNADYDAWPTVDALTKNYVFTVKHAYEICSKLGQPLERWTPPARPAKSTAGETKK